MVMPTGNTAVALFLFFFFFFDDGRGKQTRIYLISHLIYETVKTRSESHSEEQCIPKHLYFVFPKGSTSLYYIEAVFFFFFNAFELTISNCLESPTNFLLSCSIASILMYFF